jgi:hypothetical protein
MTFEHIADNPVVQRLASLCGKAG